MYYIPELGMQGNIEKALKQSHDNANNLIKETSNRTHESINNREAVEQRITELELRIIALEAKLNEEK